MGSGGNDTSSGTTTGTTDESSGTRSSTSAGTSGEETSGPTSDSAGAECGDGSVDAPEVCDGVVPEGVSCASLGLGEGTLQCTDCEFDSSDCMLPPDPICGDGEVNQDSEACDGSIPVESTCEALGFDAGATSCIDCELDTSGCHDTSTTCDGPGLLGQPLLDGGVTHYDLPSPGAVILGDFDGDGHLDVVGSGEDDDPVLYFFRGDGLGELEHTQTTIALGGNSAYGTAGDLDDDGNLDLVLSTDHANHHLLDVWMGQGDGTFVFLQSYASFGIPTGVALGDFDGDGNLDSALADQNSTNFAVRRGLGNGQLGPQLTLNVGIAGGGRDVSLADVDADGALDIVHAKSNNNTDAVIFTGLGDGSFNPVQTVELGSTGVSAVVVEDFDGDGMLDIAGTIWNFADVLSVRLAESPGVFAAAQMQYATVLDDPNGLVTGDFNCDGIPDLATMTGGATTDFLASMEVYIGDGSGLFFDAVAYPVSSAAWRLEVGDFDEDGIDDLVTSGGNANEEITLLRSAP